MNVLFAFDVYCIVYFAEYSARNNLYCICFLAKSACKIILPCYLIKIKKLPHSVMSMRQRSYGDHGVKLGVYTLVRKVSPMAAVKPFSPSSATAWYRESWVRLIAVHSTSPVWRLMVVPSLVA